MKAAILYELNQPLRMETNLEVPQPGYGQVLVELAYSGVCFSQVMERKGGRGPDRYLPHLLGHEGSGKVLACGKGVTKVTPGDHVVLGWIKGKGLDGGGVKYALNGATINAGAVTTFNDHALISENRLVALPQGIPLDLAVLLGCAVPTGAGILTNTIRPEPGSTLVFFGLGGVGLSALLALGLFADVHALAVDVNPEKLALAKRLGVAHTINPHEQDPVAAIRDYTNGGADYCVEAAGRVATIEAAFNSVRPAGGLCVFASHPPSGQTISLDPHALISGKRIMGTWGGACQPDRDVPFFAQAWQQGRLPLEELIDRRYPLAQVNQALDDLEARRVIRPLLEINPDA